MAQFTTHRRVLISAECDNADKVAKRRHTTAPTYSSLPFSSFGIPTHSHSVPSTSDPDSNINTSQTSKPGAHDPFPLLTQTSHRFDVYSTSRNSIFPPPLSFSLTTAARTPIPFSPPLTTSPTSPASSSARISESACRTRSCRVNGTGPTGAAMSAVLQTRCSRQVS